MEMMRDVVAVAVLVLLAVDFTRMLIVGRR
jgi:hypothetical protein